MARSLSLTSRLRDAEARKAVASLERARTPAAIVSSDGRLRAVNDRFAARLGDQMIDRPGGFRFAEALAAIGIETSPRSVVIPATDEHPAAVLHLLPLRRGARAVFGRDGVLILLAEAANARVPDADLLRLLFDLTPAEAGLTRHLLEGLAPAEAATRLGIAHATARTHLNRVFAKTG